MRCDTQIKQIKRALRERKPPPMQKFKTKMIPDFQINPDPDARRICPKMLWMDYLVGVSQLFRQV